MSGLRRCDDWNTLPAAGTAAALRKQQQFGQLKHRRTRRKKVIYLSVQISPNNVNSVEVNELIYI